MSQQLLEEKKTGIVSDYYAPDQRAKSKTSLHAELTQQKGFFLPELTSALCNKDFLVACMIGTVPCMKYSDVQIAPVTGQPTIKYLKASLVELVKEQITGGEAKVVSITNGKVPNEAEL